MPPRDRYNLLEASSKKIHVYNPTLPSTQKDWYNTPNKADSAMSTVLGKFR